MSSAPPYLLVPYEGHKSLLFATRAKVKSGLDIRLQLIVPLAVSAGSGKKHISGALTPGEIAILAMLAEDVGLKEGAAALRISLRAARLRIQVIRAKLGTASNEAAVARAFRLGLIK